MQTDRTIVEKLATLPARVITCAVVAVALCAAPALSPTVALGISAQTQDQLSAAQQKVADADAAYEQAQADLNRLQATIDENTSAIQQIESQLPALQQKARSAMRSNYKQNKGVNGALSFVMNSRSFSDIITTVAYMNEIQDSNLKDVQDLANAQAELEQRQTKLDQAKARLESEKEKAAEAQAQAKQARSDAQAKAEREAAEELARMAAETAAAQGTGADGENANNSANASGQTVSTKVVSGVDWSLSRDEFVSQWTGRIDAYLAGTPLAGHGRTFAEAAYDNTVDPRWSPAISMIESTCGSYCFRPYNAWGWMGRSFSNWDEAIRAHVAFLGRNYGTTLTPGAAKMYCPPTWQDWYNKVGSQMNRI